MSIYSDLLRRLLQEDDGRAAPLEELIADALASRARITELGVTDGTKHLSRADRIGDSLVYDAALVRLCKRLGVAQDLTTDVAGPATRDQAERRLAERLPSLAFAFQSTAPGSTVSER